MDKNNLEVLKEFNKAIKMGEDSYSLVIEKVKDESFKNLLYKQSNRYEQFLNNIKSDFDELNEKPTDTPLQQKIMGWTSINLNTLKDSSNSHISEILIQGAQMGIIECNKLINTYPDINYSLKSSIKNFLDLQEDVIYELTPYLKK